MRRLAVAVLIAAGCAGREAPGVTHARGWYYGDNSGLGVASVGVESEQPVSRRVTASGRVLLDRVTVRHAAIDPADPGANGQPTGHPHHHPDAVTSASAIAGDGAVADKDRWEGRAKLETTGGDRTPWRAWLGGRGSTEPDYGSLSATAGGSIALAARATELALELGAGSDRVDPVEAPPGEEDEWPATHRRITASASISQVADRAVILTAGVAATFQRGRLANPYRRALVRTTLFPEVVPDARDRWTGFIGAALAIAPGSAVHLRLGGYLDDWGVWAVIPELAYVRELGERGLLTLSYRYYQQGTADFYQARYEDLAPLMSGDPRLGPVSGHVPGAHLRWRLRGDADEAGAVTLEGGYQLIALDFPLYATDLIVGHQVTVGIGITAP